MGQINADKLGCMSDLISREYLLQMMQSDEALKGAANMDYILDNIRKAPVAYDVNEKIAKLQVLSDETWKRDDFDMRCLGMARAFDKSIKVVQGIE